MPVFDHKSALNLEEELRQTRLLLQASLECSRDDVIFSIDRDYNYLFFNNTYKNFLRTHYCLDISIGQNFLDSISNNKDRETAKSNFDHTFSGVSFAIVEQIANANYEVFYKPIHNENNDIIGATSHAKNVTEQKQAENPTSLNEGESKLTFPPLIQDLQAGIVVHGPDSEILICNDYASDFLGLTREQMQGKVATDSAWSFFHEDETPYTIDEYPVTRIFTERKAIRNLILGIKLPKNNDLVWCQVNAFPEFDEQGAITQAVVTLLDITASKRIERELKQSEFFFKESQRAALIGSYQAEYYPNDFWISSEVCDDVFGIGKDYDKTIKGWTELLHPDSKDEVIRYMMEDVIGQGNPFNLEYKIVRYYDGATRWVHGLGETIQDETGRTTGMIGTVHDITDRKKTEQEVDKLRKYLANIIDSMPSMIIGVDTNLNITQWNKQAVLITGKSVDFAVGKSLAAVLSDLKIVVDLVIEAISNNTSTIKNNTLLRNGETHHETITVFPISSTDDSGAVIRIDDVTREVELQQQLNQSQKLDAIGQLAGGIAHDFNNMIGGILGSAELLSFNLQNEERSRRYINIIMEASSRAAGLTEKLLSFARNNPKASTPIDVHNIISDTTALLGNTIDKRIQLSKELKAKSCMIIGDPSQLQNVFLNMGINSSHAIGDTGNISFTTENIILDSNYCKASPFSLDPGGYLSIEVHDTGAGIPLEQLPKVFEPFFTTKEQGKGTGLGLAAAYGTICQHHGSITVYSEENVGTTFQILLPLAEINEIIDNQHQQPALKGTGHILIVDDEDYMRVVAAGILENLGYSVEIAVNGREAVMLFQKSAQSFDVVILDMVMPIMNGRDCFNALRKIQPDVRVILSSGFSQEQDIEEMKLKGLRGFVRKPYRATQLSQVVHDVLRSKENISPE